MKKFLIVLLGLFMIGMILSVFQGQKENIRRSNLSPDQRASEDRIKAARGVCLATLKNNLHDPGSAEFGSTSEWYTEERGDGTILVQPFGRAKNAMGAFIKGTWDCVVKPEGGKVAVVSLEQIRP